MKSSQRPFSLLATAVCLLAGVTAIPLAGGQAPAPSPAAVNGKTKERRVVLVVWDGLRPDSISDETTPTLAKLAREGVFFTRHHSVYPTSTEVNGTAMMTGCYPGHSGLIANREFRPAIDPLKTVAMEDLAAIRKGDEVSDGHYLRVPTLPELLQRAGQRTVIAGTKRVVMLVDRAARTLAKEDRLSIDTPPVLFEGKTLPPEVEGMLNDRLGSPFPEEIHFPNTDQDLWTTRALTEELWPMSLTGLPSFTLLWMSDPDYTQHQFGPASPQSCRALASVDARLASVLAKLDAQHLRDSTDVLVVSDHGFSTIGRGVDFAKALTDAGFHASREYKAPPKHGDVLINGLGGTVFLYVAEHDPDTIRRMVNFLEGSDFAGVIFTRDALPGTFALKVAHIDSPDAPDIVVALRWNDDKNATGLPGAVVSDGSRKPGQGTHASLSRYDLHNTLVAAGPDFRTGWRDDLPSGNVDLAPTIAHLLGLPNPPKMDGRVLIEALKEDEKFTGWRSTALEPMEAKQTNDKSVWTQHLMITHYEGVDYIDEGNGSAESKPAP